MGQFTQDGVTYEELPNGQVRVIGHASAAPQRGAIPIGPRNNHQANADTLARDDFDRRARNDADDRDRKARQDKLDSDKYIADLYTKGLQPGPNGQLVQIPGWSPPKSAEAAVDGSNRAGRLDSLTKQINRTQELFSQGPGATKPWSMGSLGDFNPYDGDNARFNTAGASLSQQGLGAFRVPGSGTVSDRDAIMFDRANLPQSGTQDASNEEILRGLRSRVEEEYNSLGMPAPQWTGVQGAQDQNAPPMVGTGGGGNGPQGGGNDGMPSLAMQNWSNGGNAQPQTVASGALLGPKQRKEYDYGAQAHFQKMVMSGAGADDLQAEAQRMGFDAFDPAALNAVVDWHRRFPKDNRPMINPPLKQVDQTALERVSQGGPGAAGIGLANAGSFGVLGGIAPEQMAMARTAHPYAEMAGEVGGAIWGTNKLGALINKIPGGLAAKASPLARNIATDASYGTIYGGASKPDNPGAGAAMGLLGGAGGSFLGNAAAGGLGKLVGGLKASPAAQYLASRGVPLTTGSMLGGGFKSIEDRLAGLPGFGVIGKRQSESAQGVVNAARDEAGEGIGAQFQRGGDDWAEALPPEFGQAFDNALGGTSINARDPAFVQDVGGAFNAGRAIPDVNGARAAAIASLKHRIGGAVTPDDTIPGRNFQESYRGLARTTKERANLDYGPEVGGVMRQGQDALTGALERQNPGAHGAFQEANHAYRLGKVLQAADRSAINGSVSGVVGVPAASQIANAARASLAKYGGQRPFAELTDAAQSVVPNKIPDSGTAGRIAQFAAPAALVGGGQASDSLGFTDGAAMKAAIAYAMLRGGGSKVGQSAINAALFKRTDALKKIGAVIGKRKGLFGTAAVPLMLESQN